VEERDGWMPLSKLRERLAPKKKAVERDVLFERLEKLGEKPAKPTEVKEMKDEFARLELLGKKEEDVFKRLDKLKPNERKRSIQEMADKIKRDLGKAESEDSFKKLDRISKAGKVSKKKK
ncbi:MAG: hypothetical protein ABH879_08385, partial [archaeon]